MTANLENVYFNVLNDIFGEHNNTYHKTIKMKPIVVKYDSFAEYNEESNKNDLKFKVGDYARISKYKNIFAKRYTPNRSKDIFVLKQIKNAVPWTYVISDLNGEEIIGSFYEKELQKTGKKKSKLKK